MKVLIRSVESPVGRLVAVLVVALAGLGVARLYDVGDLGAAPWYIWGVSALLAVGLYGSASGIPRDAVRDLHTVVLAVTVGVMLKTALIAVVMYLASGSRPETMILGVAVAQIDPLSVAALVGRSRMSQRAKSLLLAWASFDDPITALLTIYLVTFTLGRGSGPTGGVSAYALDLALNLAFAGVVWALWLLARRLVPPRANAFPTWFRVVAVLVLAGLVAVAAWRFLMLGIALVGLFYRPGISALAERVTTGAFFLATLALGALLSGGVDLRLGVVLGVAAFAAQIVVGTLIAWHLSRVDRVYLALGQQNGITAVILALALEPYLPYAVSVVAPAILTVNVLNIATNAAWDRRRERAEIETATAQALTSPDPVRTGPVPVVRSARKSSPTRRRARRAR
ncbi:hypothetical protein [Sphaerisporangium fuscum]|uniref:hypothetical protein n=1 Tax=Sphaerisporangium fuscum TaxID=2835868 RepID=UPI001BDC8424|nr:hypothetical protein [Sphaerisporangium fuscum]